MTLGNLEWTHLQDVFEQWHGVLAIAAVRSVNYYKFEPLCGVELLHSCFVWHVPVVVFVLSEHCIEVEILNHVFIYTRNSV